MKRKRSEDLQHEALDPRRMIEATSKLVSDEYVAASGGAPLEKFDVMMKFNVYAPSQADAELLVDSVMRIWVSSYLSIINALYDDAANDSNESPDDHTHPDTTKKQYLN